MLDAEMRVNTWGELVHAMKAAELHAQQQRRQILAYLTSARTGVWTSVGGASAGEHGIKITHADIDRYVATCSCMHLVHCLHLYEVW